ncbi:DUF1488 domain-containing protein [Caballeronia sp. GAWG1-5s-s]|uniref:DUF1488 domain-containing protein n=1 Tax=Caballeronia sp. GAWG1-5s-s TaxID=2921743 RepID=UPI0032EDC4F7
MGAGKRTWIDVSRSKGGEPAPLSSSRARHITMNITFSQSAPIYAGDEPALTFLAYVDGQRIPCTISAEALEDHFGAASSREEDLRHAFELGRVAIEGAAEQLLTSVGRRPVMLRSGYFRFDDGGTLRIQRHRAWRLPDDAPAARAESAYHGTHTHGAK